MPEILLGLDIGSRYTKLVLVKRNKRRQIMKAEIIKTPDGSVIDGAIIYLDAIVISIRDYLNKSGIKPDSLAVSINSPDIITRNLKLPALSDSEIPPAVKFELLRLFPTIRDTHEITQRVISSDASSVSVLVALCPLDLLKIYRELAERLDLPLLYADVRADAQARAIEFYFGWGGGGNGDGGVNGGGSESGGASGSGGGGSEGSGASGGGSASGNGEAGLLIDIGYRNSLVSVVSRGKLVLSRYIMSGAAQYDGMVAERARVKNVDVENARMKGDFSNIPLERGAIEDIARQCFSEISDQIRQTADHYVNDITDERLAYVLVAGEGGMIPGIEAHFASSQNLVAYELAPAPKSNASVRELMKYRNPRLLLSAVGATLAGAFAGDGYKAGRLPQTNAKAGRLPQENAKAGRLPSSPTRAGRLPLPIRLSLAGRLPSSPALNEINFIPADAGGAGKGRGAASKRLAAALLAAIIIVAASITTGLYFISDQRNNLLEIAMIDLQIASDSQIAEQNSAINNARTKLSTLMAVLDSIDNQSLRASDLLEKLAGLAPESLFIANFNMVDANNAVMSGRARNYESVADFAKVLRQTDEFYSVRINSITANQSVSDAYTDYGFTITITKKGG